MVGGSAFGVVTVTVVPVSLMLLIVRVSGLVSVKVIVFDVVPAVLVRIVNVPS